MRRPSRRARRAPAQAAARQSLAPWCELLRHQQRGHSRYAHANPSAADGGAGGAGGARRRAPQRAAAGRRRLLRRRSSAGWIHLVRSNVHPRGVFPFSLSACPRLHSAVAALAYYARPHDTHAHQRIATGRRPRRHCHRTRPQSVAAHLCRPRRIASQLSRRMSSAPRRRGTRCTRVSLRDRPCIRPREYIPVHSRGRIARASSHILLTCWVGLQILIDNKLPVVIAGRSCAQRVGEGEYLTLVR